MVINKENIDNKEIVEKTNNCYEYRLDYYWKSLSLYAVVLSLFIFVKEIANDAKIIDAIYKPVIFLLIFIVTATTISLLFQIYQKKRLLISEDNIIIKNRWRERIISREKIKKITFVKDRFNKKNDIRLIRIRINRTFFLRINPGYYKNEDQLIKDFQSIKSKFNL
jgi:hypothetical protein